MSWTLPAASVVDGLGLGLLLASTEGRILGASRRVGALLGIDPASLVGQSVDQIGLERPVATERRSTRMLRKSNGEPVRQHMRAVPIQPDGQSLAWLLEFTDPPDEIEAALRKSEANYRNLVETVQDLIWSVDCEGRFTFVNPAARRMLGYDPAEMIGRRFQDFQDPEVSRRDSQVHARILAEGVPFPHYETVLRHKDGHAVHVCANAILIRDDEGRIVGTTGTSQDITERRRTEEAMRHAQKLESLGVLAGGIAHDFNNLLVGILGNAGLAERELAASSPIRAYLANIARAAQRAADLTRQLLAYTGKGQFLIGPIQINDLVQDMVELLRVSLPKKVALRLELAEGLPPIRGDSGQIQQIVLNLVTNGAEAVDRPSGLVTISTGIRTLDRASIAHHHAGWNVEPGSFVFLEVSDDGCGMPPQVLDRIFDPFFTTKETGRGLGLAAILGIVRGHRGAIHVYSEVGGGSSFKVFLPSDHTPAEEAPPIPEASVFRGTGTILIVDDSPEVLVAAQLILENAGFQVVIAPGGAEAAEAVGARPDEFAAVLLDMTMPGMTGEETFRELRRLRPDLRIVLSSGYNQLEALHRFVGRGLAGFIQKPYTPDALVEAIRAVL